MDYQIFLNKGHREKVQTWKRPCMFYFQATIPQCSCSQEEDKKTSGDVKQDVSTSHIGRRGSCDITVFSVSVPFHAVTLWRKKRARVNNLFYLLIEWPDRHQSNTKVTTSSEEVTHRSSRKMPLACSYTSNYKNN